MNLLSPDRPESPGQIFHSMTLDSVLQDVLEQARIGTLDPAWRQHPPGLTAPGGQLTDAQRLVVQEVGDRPVALWEPGVADHWRKALDAWFAAAMSIEDRSFANRMALNLKRSKPAELLQVQIAMVQPERIAAESTVPDQLWELIGGGGRHRSDETLYSTLAVHISRRDWLCAGWLAGLAAGGTPGPDWRTWLTERAGQWKAPAPFSRRVEIEVRTRSHYLDQLPAYWNPVAP